MKLCGLIRYADVCLIFKLRVLNGFHVEGEGDWKRECDFCPRIYRIITIEWRDFAFFWQNHCLGFCMEFWPPEKSAEESDLCLWFGRIISSNSLFSISIIDGTFFNWFENFYADLISCTLKFDYILPFYIFRVILPQVWKSRFLPDVLFQWSFIYDFKVIQGCRKQRKNAFVLQSA